jgi:hypothetical protein
MMKNKLFTLLIALSILPFTVFAQSPNLQSLQNLLIQQGLSLTDVQELVITDMYTSKNNGVTHVYFRQKYNGIEVYNALGSAHFKQGQVVALQQSFVNGISTKTQGLRQAISASAAITNTATFLNLKTPTALNKTDLTLTNYKTQLVDTKISAEPIKVQVYYLVVDAGLKLVYNTNWLDDASGNWWNVRVDAATGEVLDQNNWSVSCTNHVHQTFGKTAVQLATKTNGAVQKTVNPRGTYNALPLGVESPIHGSRALLVNPADSLASPWGWHDTNAVEGPEYTITRGNNVYASDDKNNTNTPGSSPDGGDSLVFDFDYQMTTGSDVSNLDAATTNLFVWNNYMHDVMYHYGFDETSGNFQANNYNRGGEGADAVAADAQDGSGTNNANFATPPDGQTPRMQMYLWSNGATSSSIYLYATDSAKTDSAVVLVSGFGPKKFTVENVELKLVSGVTSGNSLACETLNSLTGKVALIDRSTPCNSTTRIRNAQAVGAVMAIVINNTTSQPFAMSGNAPDITIPSVIITKAAGDALKARLLLDTVTISLNTNMPLLGLYDSDLDNGVIAHEYGHGISNRLTGGPSNTNCMTNQEQAGEGWSDFFCLVLTHRKTDDPTVGRGIGTWVNFEPTSGLGIRNYKYSRSLTVNPSTYNSIKTLAVPHGVGSVWCTMLYDLYWNMIDKYGYDSNLYTGKGGNNRCLQLVMDGLKLQPCNPGFVDARNAILLADKMNNNGADSSLIWSTFARRGLGYSAKQGLSTSRSDGTEAYDLPPTNTTGLTNWNKESGMAIWPNPNNGQFELLMPEGATSVWVELFDVTGRSVYSQTLTGTERVQINTTALHQGIYVLKAESKGKIYSTKVVVTP